MDRKSAEAIARTYVAELEKKLDIDLTLVNDQTIEFSSGWAFFYDSRRYVESGSISDALVGNAPLIVSRRDGSVHVTGTAYPIENYIREFERTHGS